MKLSSVLLNAVLGDIYLHSPRGSNNRLNEANTGRRNGNRLFDSQNNNNGGYNVGDKFDVKAEDESGQAKEMYFQSGATGKSYLTIEWTNQHGCGAKNADDTNEIDCHLVMQYKCESANEERAYPIRNGFIVDTPQFSEIRNFEDEDYQEKQNRKAKDENVNSKIEDDGDSKVRGRHETWENYDACRARPRNKHLFIADQKVRGRSTDTRQNPNGQRRGYECPEERDYYPYWHPTEWTDIAILTDNELNCDFYQNESSNRMPKGECVEYYKTGEKKHYSTYNNEEDCKRYEQTWLEFYDYLKILDDVTTPEDCDKTKEDTVWGYPRQIGEERHQIPEEKCLVLHPKPDCKKAPWSRANHLGNTLDGEHSQYKWELPNFYSEDPKECVFRFRYNISTHDYPENFDAPNIATYFDHKFLENDPKILTKHGIELDLAINTAQIARTFQDRSHNFILMPRSLHGIDENLNIENMAVRGKRGNIVQTFPAVEYDFIPQNLHVTPDTAVHIQWAGSNTNPRNNDGEGKRGSDRNNIVSVDEMNWSHPQGYLEIEDYEQVIKIWKDEQNFDNWLIHKQDFKDYDTLRTYCSDMGMEIPVPLDEESNRALTQVTGGNFFLGITDEETEGTFKNIYTNTEIEYENWNRREPNNYKVAGHKYFHSGENYAVFINNNRGADGRWNDFVADWENSRWGARQAVCWKKLTDEELEAIINPVQQPFMFSAENLEWLWTSAADDSVMTNYENLELQMATSGFYDCVTGCENSIESVEKDWESNMDDAPASFLGNMVRFKNAGQTHHFMCTRNNNFSNRAQKSHIKVVATKDNTPKPSP